MLGWEGMVCAWPLEHFLKMVWSALRGLPATLAVSSGYELVIVPLFLILSLGGAVGGALTGALIPPYLAVRVVEDGPNGLLS